MILKGKGIIAYVILGLALWSCGPSRFVTLRKAAGDITARHVSDSRTGIASVVVSKAGKGKVLLSGETTVPEVKEEMVNTILNAGLKVIDSLQVLPAGSVGEKPWGLVSVSVANIRTRPSHAAEMATQAIMGTPVRILKKQDGWLMVQTPDSYLGWTTPSSLQALSKPEFEAWRHSERLIFTGMTGNVLALDDSGQVISDLVAGTIVNTLGESGSVFKVRLPDGREGQTEKTTWAYFSEWRSGAEPDTVNIPATAKRFAGLPYLWGGTSSKALDCSGFTKTVYFLNGILTERDASQQIRNGQVVSPANNFADLIPGDLLFFGNRDPFRVIHVGIWMGDSRVIHASGFVRTDSMDPRSPETSDYLTGTFLGEVRRIIGAPQGKGLIKVKEHPWY